MFSVPPVQEAVPEPEPPRPPPPPVELEPAPIPPVLPQRRGPVVLRLVAEAYCITVPALEGSRRTLAVVWPRQVAYWLLTEVCRYSCPKAGQVMGGRDHTTVLHGKNKVAREIARGTARGLAAVRLHDALLDRLRGGT
jgi:hypothetical protein